MYPGFGSSEGSWVSRTRSRCRWFFAKNEWRDILNVGVRIGHGVGKNM